MSDAADEVDLSDLAGLSIGQPDAFQGVVADRAAASIRESERAVGAAGGRQKEARESAGASALLGAAGAVDNGDQGGPAARGGVCAPGLASPLDPAPLLLVPDQPSAPGSPFGSPVVQAPSAAPVTSSQSSCLAGKSPVPLSPLSQTVGLASKKRSTTASPYKPVTPEQVLEFSRRWADASITVTGIAKLYRVSDSAIRDWVKEFGLRNRPELIREQATQASKPVAELVQAARDSAAVTWAMARVQDQERRAAESGGQANGLPGAGQVCDPRLDPLKDPVVAEALRHLEVLAKDVTAHSDLTALQRAMARFSVLLAVRNPFYTWGTIQGTAEGLNRALIANRSVEGKLPEGKGDPAVLRREAAANLFKEMKEHLSPEEQVELGRMVKTAVDRMKLRGAASGGSA